jgi:signal transduction histidine kinase
MIFTLLGGGDSHIRRWRGAMSWLRSWVDPAAPSSISVGMASALSLMAAVTLLIFPLKRLITPAALDVLYIPVVLFLTAKWGVRVGVFASVLGVLLFDYFQIGPVHQLSDLDTDGVVFLAATAAAVCVAAVSGRARSAEERRRQEVIARGRMVAAADEERRRVVRDLHDGAQQRLVHAVIVLKMAVAAMKGADSAARGLVQEALQHAEQANSELRELAHGILPSVLTRGGLRAGVNAITARMTLPVTVDLPSERFPPAVEATAYFVVNEALTNIVKYANATRASVWGRKRSGQLHIEVTDDGVGDARVGPRGGLAGLEDRMSALGGQLTVDSPRGEGTRLIALLPVREPN